MVAGTCEEPGFRQVRVQGAADRVSGKMEIMSKADSFRGRVSCVRNLSPPGAWQDLHRTPGAITGGRLGH